MFSKRSLFNCILITIMLASLVACQPPPATTATAPPATDTSASSLQPTPTCAPMLYGDATSLFHIPSTGYSYNMKSADFNGDSLMDIVVARAHYPTAEVLPLEILLNDGAGGFEIATEDIYVDDIPTTQHPRHVLLADFNGDDITDIFIADHGQDVDPFPGYPNTLVLSAPGGRLMDASDNIPQQPDYSHSAAAADIDADGDIDLYVGNYWGESMIPPQILLNDGTGRFTVADGRLPPDQINLELNSYTGSGFADVNNDDAPDLILAGDQLTPSIVLLNDGDGVFTMIPDAIPAKPFDQGDIGVYIVSEDINDDGYQDLIISYALGWYEGKYLQILINNGDSTFRDETETRLPQSENVDKWVQEIALHDLDRDGDLDITTKTMEYTVMTHPYYLNDGDGFFHQPDDPVQYTYPWTVFYVFIDIDGDGGLDTVSVTLREVFYIIRDLGCN